MGTDHERDSQDPRVLASSPMAFVHVNRKQTIKYTIKGRACGMEEDGYRVTFSEKGGGNIQPGSGGLEAHMLAHITEV